MNTDEQQLSLPRLAYILVMTVMGFASASSLAAEKPNIIFILADDWGLGDVKTYGGDRCKIDTPHMDQLAAMGMKFTDAHSSSSVCTPTRYSVLTGRYNWRSRMKQGVLFGFSGPLIEPGRETVASMLKKNGYETGMIGKWHLGMNFASTDGRKLKQNGSNTDWQGKIGNGPTAVGFDYCWGIAASLDMPPYIWIKNDRFVGECTVKKGFNRKGPAHADFEAVDVLPTLTKKAVAYVSEQAKTKNPFFLYMPLNSPHTPIVPSKKFQRKSALGAYGDFVMETDWSIGEVVKAVEQAGIADNTLIIVTADNGCSPAARNGFKSPGQLKFRMDKKVAEQPDGHYASDIYRGHKADIYEGGHRVPFIARWDGKVKAGSVADDPVCLVDLFATCADIVGAEVADTAAEDSISILPVLLGTTKGPLREAVVHHSINGSFAIRQGKWKLAFCPGSGGWSHPAPGGGKPRKDRKQVDPAKLAEHEWVQLFDMDADPSETTNLSDQFPEVVNQLTQLAEEYINDGRSTPGAKQQNNGKETELYPKWIRKTKEKRTLLSISIGTARAIEKPHVKTSIDWENFLEGHDLLWSRMPTKWYEAPFLGNGMMGAMVMQADEQSVRWEVGRGDVQDHRPAGRKFGYDTCRLPIGNFELKTVGKITGGTMRLDLWNAEATGEIQTEKGSIRWQTFVHAQHMAIVVSLEPSEGEKECRWEWKALPAISPRQAMGRKMRGEYKPNPPSKQEKVGKAVVCSQPLLSGGETATAWFEQEQGKKKVLMVSVAHSFPEATAGEKAFDELNSAANMPLDELLQSHRAWWHAYYPASFLSFSDTYWESFYWIQMYKLAAATRSDRMLIDNTGPWLQITPWPGAWWNLNVQLSYWPTYTSNRHELSKSLDRTLYSNVDTLIANVPEQYRSDSAGLPRASGQDCAGPVAAPNGKNQPEIGLLLWACHNCWLHYRHTMDEETLRNHLFPLLKRAVNYHLHFLSTGEDGKLHLPKTFSPEYGKHGPDCNFDLALLRWGCEALIEACERLNIDDPRMPRWKEVLDNLTDYPTHEDGYMIARGVPFDKGHRHYSHLLMLYPLYLVNREQEGAEQLMLTSVSHWQSLGGRQGYSLTGASSISSAFGRGNDALEYLNGLKEFLQPNTLYKEAGPVIETPLSGAQSIHDMVLQSWGGTIRVFPAAPDAWRDIAVHDLSAEGAFLVSAKRKAGKTEFVQIKSLAGEPCVIMPGLEGTVQVSGNRNFELTELNPGVYALDLKKGEEAILWSGDRMPDLTLAPVAADMDQLNSFGLK